MLYLLIGARRRLVYTLPEAAAFLGCSTEYVRGMRLRGRVKAHRHGGTYYYDADSVHLYKMTHPKLGRNRKVAV